MYNVLWLDDEPEKMSYFKEICKDDYCLNLESYKIRRDGLAVLDRDVEHWDAAILDAKMFNETENEKIGLQGLREVIEKLKGVSRRKAIPYFIFTGQPDLVSDAHFNEIFGDFYRKGDKNEWVRLCNDMLSAIKSTQENQIKAKYQDVFEALAAMKLPRETESILLDILLPLHYPGDYTMFESKHHYTRLRKEVEYLFRAFHRVGLVPDQCIPGGKVNLNQCSIYLSGKPTEHAGVQYGDGGDRVVPEYIEKIIKSILEFGNTNSHTVDLEKVDEDRIVEILSGVRSNYLIFGSTLQLCEVIVWAAIYISSHSDKEKNLSYCRILPPKEENKSSLPQEVIDKYEGQIFELEYDEELRVWHCEECFVVGKNLESGIKLKLNNIVKNTQTKLSDKYPYYAKYDKC